MIKTVCNNYGPDNVFDGNAHPYKSVFRAKVIQHVLFELNAGLSQCSLCQALDCFTASLPRPESRLQIAEVIGSKLNISKEKVSVDLKHILTALIT